MLDPLIIQALNTPSPPAIVQPFASGYSQQGFEGLERTLTQHIQQRTSELEDWLAGIEALREKSGSIFVEEQPSQADLATLDLVVSRTDTRAEEWIKKSKQAHKKGRRIILRAGLTREQRTRIDQLVDRSKAIDERILQGLLDFAWTVRAIRATVAPDAGSGPTFDNVDNLERYLATIS